ncbi:hypothetical protein [Pseudomonas amygdali]|uniref:hypothetical protein n=1 Tax=Pseudomonas amygdali TaxID=47877 RepID=UPI000D2EF0E9|nr:hypothetical protein [Pseudomonas amygdali]POC98127.1 hypothetical protein BKM22_27520 [Pseudomonas amygdali pv. morsprunorum]POD37022.1 hypothetical protein BKM16_27375 [Pseudomonas amygdali pv. morsprunorum]POD39134.1 hypothetical protein BKM02_26950 [Pseudomonas amygdali pv. morsprunorum]
MKSVRMLTLMTASLFSAGLNIAVAAPPSVHLYNWYGFIAPDTSKEFERETGSQLLIDSFDSAEIMGAVPAGGEMTR